MTTIDLAAALNDLIAQASASGPAKPTPSLEDAFAALLADTSLEPPPIRDEESFRIS